MAAPAPENEGSESVTEELTLALTPIHCIREESSEEAAYEVDKICNNKLRTNEHLKLHI